MVHLTLVGCSTTMPEKHPLQGFIPLQLVLESELVFLVGELEQVQQLGGGLNDRVWRRLAVVHKHRDAAIGVETQEPFLLLLVCHDVDERGAPGGAVGVGKFLQHDLGGLPIGGILRDQVQALGLGHLLRRIGDIEIIRHCKRSECGSNEQEPAVASQ